MFRNRFSRFCVSLTALAFAAVLAPSVALAQTDVVDFDPAPVMAIVANAQTFIITIGLGVLVLLMVAKGIKWARKAG